jgi:hypothetical protein
LKKLHLFNGFFARAPSETGDEIWISDTRNGVEEGNPTNLSKHPVLLDNKKRKEIYKEKKSKKSGFSFLDAYSWPSGEILHLQSGKVFVQLGVILSKELLWA